MRSVNEITNEMKNKDEYKSLSEKLDALINTIKGYESVAIAFSGGVDSTLLLKVAHDTLGDNCIALTAKSESFPERERRETVDFCEQEGIKRVEIESEELDIPGFSHNPKNRCYICKKELFTKLLNMAEKEGMKCVAEGSNLDDNGDYRPGLQAIDELGIKSPLREAHLTKAEIRELSKLMSLPTWDKPSFACLASRFVYGEEITRKKLSMVDRAELLLLNMGFKQVRVRIHGESLARIEVPKADLEKLLNNREVIVNEFRKLGFIYVTMDMTGYRTGAMNEVL